MRSDALSVFNVDGERNVPSLRPGFRIYVVSEEVLEMLSALLLGLALLAVLQAHRIGRSECGS